SDSLFLPLPVFFGNEDLLKEWLKGAGVTGQPGVDYPALTSIPATSFSCRGLRGGYYADLETNCQVFHICDNGRKISFLCPNGTIFQQSQLICDWWFKVDCSKSTELYEQSVEQLAEEEKKRAEARKMKSEFHREAEEQNNADYYENDYDGRQNGRTNPYGQSTDKQNQISERQNEPKSNQHFGPNNVFENTRGSGRFQENNANALRTNEKTSQIPDNYDQPSKQRQYHDNGSNYQAVNRQRNQLDTQNNKFNYEHNNKFQDNRQNYQSNTQNYQSNQNTPRNEKPAFNNPKSRTSTRNNLFSSNQSQKATPTYMETTTFRTTTTAPPKEYQQFAESAAFVSNRGHRFNSGKSENARQYYYHSYDYRDHTTTTGYRGHETTTSTPQRNKESETVSFTPKTGAPPYPGPTYAPIYKPRTTTLPPYETTLQYTPTTETSQYSTPSYKQDDILETTYTNVDTTTVTSFPSAEEFPTAYSMRTSPAVGRIPPASGNYRNQQYIDNRVTEQKDTDTSFATTRPYVNTESYRHNAANVTSTISPDAFPTTSVPCYDECHGQTYRPNYQYENSITNIENKSTTLDPWRATLQSFQQNSISSTEKPWKSTNGYQQSGSTSKTLSPYDTSFTYKQGKVLSTLSPYVPFTKNYVYSTMTTTPTPKPPTTVPTYSSTLTNYRITASNLIPKVKSSSPATSKPKDRATYLPEVGSKPPPILEDRPYAEREHALSMLHSLQGLENNGENLSEIGAKDGNSRNGPSAPGPSTLHSLALYFATAGDNLDSNETIESTASVEEAEGREDSHSHNMSVELPTSILTQHTISSYVELFNLNNALEGNATMAEFTSEADDLGGEINEDLEIEQSEGPVNGAKRSNNTKLRELAQVFTHALSAYLQDPETFKKVLTEIRPTQPPTTTIDDDQFEMTTLYPTTAEEYASVTKEKDEVLDFSDDTDVTRRRKPTTIFPTTSQPPVTTDRSYSTYYTTPYDEYTTLESQTRRPIYYPSTTLLPPSASSHDARDYVESSTQSGNTFAFEVNRVFTTTMNDIQNYDGDTRDTTDLSSVYDNYFPLDEYENRNKIGGFQNNTARTFQPYGKNVKPIGATPISNYMASSTVPSFINSGKGTTLPSWGRGSAGDKPVQNLTPPHYYQHFGNVKSFTASNSILPNQVVRSTTPLSRSKSSYKTASTTGQPFRIRYYESTTAPSESLATARSSYSKYRNNYKENNHKLEGTRKPLATTTATTIRDNIKTLDPVTATVSDATPYTTVIRATSNPTDVSTTRHANLLNNDHWTSSPMVTQLWETTVFVDPRHINHGLQSNIGTTQLPDTTDNAISEESEPTITASTARSSKLSDVDLDVTTESRTTSTPSPWQWATSDNDPPVTFTLLPTTFTAENTATPTPIITTRSSITTTITSSVTSTNAVSRDNLASTLLPFAQGNALNATESEVIKAHEMFGKLNETSSNTLMRVMKQADSNATVRQLVLLLISHCNGPRNKTMEQEKEQLLDALLRMPVNEFSSEESREIIAGINRLNFSIPKLRAATSYPTTIRTPRASSVRPTPSALSVTTFRSRTGRKFRTTTENVNSFARRSDDAVSETNNSLSENEATASDSRALELLRSLYTVAAKWG
ncbi:PREDICTED: mucin-5AC-like, partial [Cyphomyrmex costatus]|uniref:mucin-5AC-like n=1 Tax=Cyphomyrmex costatus TaxID=456900 RepID=UPI0008523A3D